jgi:hypothetical protein
MGSLVASGFADSASFVARVADPYPCSAPLLSPILLPAVPTTPKCGCGARGSSRTTRHKSGDAAAVTAAAVKAVWDRAGKAFERCFVHNAKRA